MRSKDHTGLVVGMLTILGEAPKHASIKHRRVFVRCKCGVEKDVNLPSLLTGKIKSCGCLSTEWVKSSWKIGKREAARLKTHADIESVIAYHPGTGEFYWKQRPAKFFSSDKSCVMWNAQWAGKRACAMDTKGYGVVAINGKLVRAHRLDYFLIHGEWPKVSIDHINGNKADNRWANLRHATRCENQRNQKRPKTNTSGHKGVVFDKKNKTWYFQMRMDGGSRFTKTGFKTKEEAVKACHLKRKELHKDFANHG